MRGKSVVHLGCQKDSDNPPGSANHSSTFAATSGMCNPPRITALKAQPHPSRLRVILAGLTHECRLTLGVARTRTRKSYIPTSPPPPRLCPLHRDFDDFDRPIPANAVVHGYTISFREAQIVEAGRGRARSPLTRGQTSPSLLQAAGEIPGSYCPQARELGGEGFEPPTTSV